MPRVAKAKAETKATEKPVENNEKPVIKNSELEVKDHMKANGSDRKSTRLNSSH